MDERKGAFSALEPLPGVRNEGALAPGHSRPATARISARDDIEAIGHWLAEYAASPQTLRAYRKEAERLMLWLADNGLALRDIDRRWLEAYESFLADPRPTERWIGPPRARSHPQWRPFRGPLSAASRRQSLVILQGLFAWLVEAGWVEHNPFRLMRDKRRRMDNRQTHIERYLERPIWDWLWQWLNRPCGEETTSRQRLAWHRRRFMFGFGYLLAPRIAEMAQARMSDFQYREGRWWWNVIGKGSKRASIPVPPDMLVLLTDWRIALGMDALPDRDDERPVLCRLDGRTGVTDNQLYRLIKEAFRDAASDLARQDTGTGQGGVSAMSRQLAKASPHWLRHTAITHQAQAGVELRYLAKTARHTRLDTTARYLHAEAEEWQRQIATHRLDIAARADDTGSESL
ncbi:site-specific integrase [Halomonas sp. McH1-25]|uniref:tyrosine-type recombinase/integrase n=1 Tax=unclassified Halomonas TaxID=2609666 RepID=UPI001EF6246B|nr:MULTISPECIES: site-specific integrase [unclassified Halomonas]MCG7598456.1 site-specific integrase [Halomonas sp. McH1-25]MCP1343463.1 site-specific integrase [Halomonas sp. FL8]MCP1361377.1 site-specific integrase [Halomonas sp. BBD45]MCP1365596.1 site-specific integrase [Halomonas sp. BBD48]